MKKILIATLIMLTPIHSWSNDYVTLLAPIDSNEPFDETTASSNTTVTLQTLTETTPYGIRVNGFDIVNINEINLSHKVLNDTEIQLTGYELEANKGKIEKFIKNNPHIKVRLSLDVGKSNFLKRGFLNVFRKQRLKMDNSMLPQSLEHLRIIDPDGVVTQIKHNFLKENKNLKTFEISNFPNLKSIKGSFMEKCKNLETFKMSDLPKLEVLGKNFVKNCKLLRKVLFTGNIYKMKNIGNSFLSGCKLIKMVDLKALRNVRIINMDFLRNCKNLEVLDISSFKKLEMICYGFLHGCPKIKDLKFHNPENKRNRYTKYNIMVPIIMYMLHFSENIEFLKLGIQLMKQYNMTFNIKNICKYSEELNIDKIKGIAPTYTPNDNLSNNDIIQFFKKYINKLEGESWVENKDILITDGKSNLQRVLEKIFVDQRVKVAWARYDDPQNRKQIELGIRTFVNFAEKLKDENRKISYVYQLLEGFKNCQTGQAMTLEAVMKSIGALEISAYDNAQSIIYYTINKLKMKIFDDMIREKSNVVNYDSHDYAAMFTIVNNLVRLPSVLNGFQEKNQTFVVKDKLKTMEEYLEKFNKDSIIKACLENVNKSINDKDVKINAYAFRNIIIDKLENKDNVIDYFNSLRDVDNQITDFDTLSNIPLKESEIIEILKALDIIIY